MKNSRLTDSQIIAVLKQAEAGTPVPELCREHGISSATFYKWRSKFGGMEVSMVARMKELEDENRRLKKMYADAQLSADLLKVDSIEQVQDHATRWLWTYNHERPNMALGGITPMQKLALAA